MNHFLGFAVAVLGLSVVEVASGDVQSDIEARVAEIETFEAGPAIWEGRFQVVSAPQNLLDSIKQSDPDNRGIRIRVHLNEDSDPELFLWYADADDWSEISGDSSMYPSLLGWTVFVQRYDGQWIEKYNITFTQVEAAEAAITFTRIVHNWYISEPTDEYSDFYHMFGFGRVEKRKSSASADEQLSELSN